MRGTDSNIFFREKSYPQFRLHINGTNGRSEVLLTGHQNSSFDEDEYDTAQLTGQGQLNLSVVQNGKAYSIQSVPELSAKVFDLKIETMQAEEIRFDISDMKALEGKTVYLEDREQNKFIALNNNPYQTTITAGSDANRFKLHISDSNNATLAYIDHGNVFLNDAETTIKAVRLSNLEGKLVDSGKNKLANWNQLAAGVYLLEIVTNEGSQFQKVLR